MKVVALQSTYCSGGGSYCGKFQCGIATDVSTNDSGYSSLHCPVAGLGRGLHSLGCFLVKLYNFLWSFIVSFHFGQVTAACFML